MGSIIKDAMEHGWENRWPWWLIEPGKPGVALNFSTKSTKKDTYVGAPCQDWHHNRHIAPLNSWHISLPRLPRWPRGKKDMCESCWSLTKPWTNLWSIHVRNILFTRHASVKRKECPRTATTFSASEPSFQPLPHFFCVSARRSPFPERNAWISCSDRPMLRPFAKVTAPGGHRESHGWVHIRRPLAQEGRRTGRVKKYARMIDIIVIVMPFGLPSNPTKTWVPTGKKLGGGGPKIVWGVEGPTQEPHDLPFKPKPLAPPKKTKLGAAFPFLGGGVPRFSTAFPPERFLWRAESRRRAEGKNKTASDRFRRRRAAQNRRKARAKKRLRRGGPGRCPPTSCWPPWPTGRCSTRTSSASGRWRPRRGCRAGERMPGCQAGERTCEKQIPQRENAEDLPGYPWKTWLV